MNIKYFDVQLKTVISYIYLIFCIPCESIDLTQRKIYL